MKWSKDHEAARHPAAVRRSRHWTLCTAALFAGAMFLSSCGPVTIRTEGGDDGVSRMRVQQSGDLDFQAVVGPKNDAWALLIVAEGSGSLVGTTQVATVRGPDGWQPYCCGATTHDVRYRVGRPGEPEVRVFFEDRVNANFVPGTYTVETIAGGRRYQATTTVSSTNAIERAQNARADVRDLSHVQVRWDPVGGAEVYRACVETPHVAEVVVQCVWSDVHQADIILDEPLERRGWGHYHVSIYAFSADVRDASRVDPSKPFSVSQGTANLGDTTGF